MTREKITAAAKAAGRLLRRAAMQTLGGKPVSRRRFFAGMAGLAAATGVSAPLAKTVRRKILAAQLRHEITFGLTMHGSSEDAKHFARVVQAAELLGQPYHAIGAENIATPKGKLEEWFLNLKAVFDKDLKHYEKLLKEGRTPKEALAEVRQIWDVINAEISNTPDFSTEMYMLAFTKKLPTIPIEEYSKEEHEQIKELNKKFMRKVAETLVSEKTLSEQIGAMEEAARINARYFKARNDRIKETIPKVIAILRKHYPHLAREPELRILYQLGEQHSGAIAPLHFTKRREDVSFAPSKATLAPQIFHKLSVNPRARLSKEEKAKLVLTYHIYPKLIDFIQQGEMGALEDFRAGIAKTTLEDFRELDVRTAGKPYEEKYEIIAQYLKKKAE